jgi:hypothetical protein
MSIAYRGQQQIAGVQQVLAAARAAIELDAKQAGLEMAQGFKIFNEPAGKLHSPVTITNSSTGPDQIAFFYADTSIQAVVTTGGSFPGGNSLDLVNVDPVGGFLPDDLVVLVKPDAIGGGSGIGPNDALIANYDACVLQVATASSGQVTLATNGLWSNGIFNYCPDPASGPMLYKFVARAYRIDPSQPGLGVLQQSPTGGLLGNANDNWTPLAFGFTDLQAALQIYDGNAADLDGDGLVDREWYSGDAQRAQTDPVVQPVKLPIPLQISISLVARTDRDVEGISTARTPELTEAGLVPLPWPTCCTRANNPLGDHPSVPLPSTDPALLGARIYRYITFQVDFRNLGVGR